MENKEQIYNEKIKPLVEQLYDLCKMHGIPFLATFEVSDEGVVGSQILSTSQSEQLHLMSFILRCGAPMVLLGLASEQVMADVPVKVVD